MQDTNITFVDWQNGAFVKVNPSIIFSRSQHEAIQKPVPIGARHILYRFVASLPFMRPAYRLFRQHIGRRGEKQIPNQAQVAIDPGDLLFIGQGLWNDEAYIEAVLQHKAAGGKLVQVVYDMLPVIAPQFSGHSTAWLENYGSKIYPQCDLILSISKSTSKDLINWLSSKSLSAPPIREFRLGEDYAFVKPQKPELRLPKQFLLCVGTIEVRKNHAVLYYAYKQAKSKQLTLPPTVVVGRRGWRTENIVDVIMSDPDTKDKILLIENASDEELAWLYTNCRFTIYPSFYEGWGLPIGESMHYGVPCLCSNTSSMPEVARDAAIYFNPTSADELLAAMNNLLDDSELRRAKEKVKKYRSVSWDETYAQLRHQIEGVEK